MSSGINYLSNTCKQTAKGIACLQSPDKHHSVNFNARLAIL